ncbi:VOC family protein [Zavarzinia sp. CC-PAN008]|uniref:VOC family protein n=1 Tax=Zavarzinia sp. CC-PAN008 TaxID=3243332 RepID=UPI003F749479
MNAVDHLVLGAPDLDQAVQRVAALTGVMPVIGGSHPGLGTRNALLSLGPRRFLEILAPDPAQVLSGTEGEVLAALPALRLMTFGLACGDLDRVHAALKVEGISTPPRTLQRTRPDGVLVRFSELIPGPWLWGHSLPFWIDWHDSPHPGDSSPAGCAFERVAVLSPDAGALAATYARLGIGVPVEAASSAGFLARIATPRGPVWLTG